VEIYWQKEFVAGNNIERTASMPPEVEHTNHLDHSNADQTGTLRTIRQSVSWISLPFGILGFVLPIYGKEISAGALQIDLFFSFFFFMTVVLRSLVGGCRYQSLA
jgi:hypothetical protein